MRIVFTLAVMFSLVVAAPFFANAEEPPTPENVSVNLFQPLEVQAGGDQPASETSTFILEIRERLGLNPLKGTVLDTPNSQPAFVAELNRIEKQQATAPLVPTLPPLPEAIATSPQLTLPKVGMYDADPALVDSLRTAAREIDRKANDWEMQNQFERADFLRGVANQIRGIARQHTAVK